ncbi:unnamed protein product, partial [Didymodactylos carnosus]
MIREGLGSTINTRRHLSHIHGKHALLYESYKSRVLMSHPRTKEYHDAAVVAIIVNGRAYCDFKKNGMQSFLQTIAPGYYGPSAHQVRSKILTMYKSKCAQFKQDLSRQPFISLTADAWRSGKYHSFLVITVHYTTDRYVSVSKVLSFRRFYGRHFAPRVKKHLERVINWFDIKHTIVAIITDNDEDSTNNEDIDSDLNDYRYNNNNDNPDTDDNADVSVDQVDDNDSSDVETIDEDDDEDDDSQESDDSAQSRELINQVSSLLNKTRQLIRKIRHSSIMFDTINSLAKENQI